MYQLHYLHECVSTKKWEDFEVKRKYWIKQDGQYFTASGSIIEKTEKIVETVDSDPVTTVEYQLFPVLNGTTDSSDFEFDQYRMTVAEESNHVITAIIDSGTTGSIKLVTTIIFVPYDVTSDLPSVFDLPDVTRVIRNISCNWILKDL